MSNTNKELITVYSTSSFMGNVIKYEGKLLDCGHREYAQYKNVPFVGFIPKRKRKGVRLLKGYQPYLVVLKGHGHPDADDIMQVISTSTDGTVVKQSKYSSFDDRYTSEFNELLDSYLTKPNVEVLLDHRWNKQ